MEDPKAHTISRLGRYAELNEYYTRVARRGAGGRKSVRALGAILNQPRPLGRQEDSPARLIVNPSKGGPFYRHFPLSGTGGE